MLLQIDEPYSPETLHNRICSLSLLSLRSRRNIFAQVDQRDLELSTLRFNRC